MQTDRWAYPGTFWGVLFVTVLAVLLMAPTAHAADNSGCTTCHSVTTNFTVTPVDRDSACAKCHIPGLVGSHPYHHPGSYCGSVCHPGWGDTLMTAVPSYYDSAAGASFASATSKATSPALLHVIHANPRWPGSMDRPASACSSCHAAAACSACHEGAIDPAHATHGSSTYPQWSGRVGHGVVGADQSVKTAGTQTNQCATSACHDLEGTRSLSVRLHEDYSHAVGQNTFDPTVANTVVTTGTWLTRFNSQRTAGRFMFSATAGSTHSLTFTGTRVELISDKDPYRGRAEVFIDNVSQGIIDCYAPSTTAQAVVFVADDLTPGEHTIRVRVLGQKQAAARAAYVVVDAYRVYDGIPDSIAPECLSCHADKGEGHGGDFDHVATNVTGIYPGPDPDYSCSACHSLNMFTEHARASSSSKAAGCGACHTTYAGYALNTYDGTCSWSGCHQAANGHEPHVAASTLHIAADAATQQCRDCHGSDLALVHENAPNRCLTCHGPALYPTTTSCIDAVCHATSGVVSIETHPAPAHDASGTDAGVARTGGYACSTCHVLELVDEHAKPTSRGTGDTAISCASCHAASYFPAGWSGGAPSTNTCVACHDPAGAADAGVPHTAAGYGVAHDLRPYGSNASSCGTLAGAYCHGGASALLGDIAFADLLHDASKPGTATCTSCHTTNTATPQVRTCSTCHATGHDLAGSHTATPARFAANAECTGCHVAYGDLTAHTKGCAGCHGNTTLTAGGTRYLTGTFTGLCTGCHSEDPHNPLAHTSPDTGFCLRCHEGPGGAATSDIRDVSFSAAYGGGLAHADCATCHNGGANLGATKSADCISCHNGSDVGLHLYNPYNLNHYDVTAHFSSQVNSGSYGSANGQALKDWNYATISSWSRPCTACHTTDLMTEHVKNSIAFSLGGKADKCVACHELKADTFSARWNGSCAGESSACHNVANGQLHNNWATKHNASSQVMSQPGTSVTRANTTVVNETWGTGTTWPTAWTRSDTTNITVVTGGRTGSRLRITSNSTTRTTRTVVRTFNTSAYNDGVSFSVWYQTAGLSTATGSNRDWMRIEYSPNNGTTWYPIEELSGNVGTWTNVRTDLPAVTQLQIRLSASFNAGSGEFAYFDDLVIEGTTKTTAALPAGSTAAASCQNNPNGTECHDVSDVASIHSGLSNFGCDRCHNATQHPAATQLNCQTAACHPGVNRDHHAANQHTTSFSSTAVFGAGFAPASCSGCHDDNLDQEHQLAAYASTPCSICHRKSGNSPAPTSVTKVDNDATVAKAANTALCTDCHKTVSKASIHVQRQGWNGAAHTGSAAIGGTQFNDAWSGHRVYSTMPGMKTTFTTAVDGTTATWSLPGTIANMFTPSSGLTATSIVTCADCHGSVTGATGPHGAAMKIGVDPDFPAPYTSAHITTGNAIASNITGAGLPICAKCHQNTNLFNGTVNGNVHNRSNHKGTANGVCNNCHVRTPHAWKRPRLIGYMSDPPPYQSQMVLGIATGNKSPTGWSSGGCGVNGCGSHGTVGAWP